MKNNPIAKLVELYSELEALEKDASDTLLAVKIPNKDNEHTLVRNGKRITLKEAVLWQEVLHLGADSQAGGILKGLYPIVFEKYALHNQKADELKEFTVRELGIDYNKMRVIDIIRLVDLTLDYRGYPAKDNEQGS